MTDQLAWEDARKLCIAAAHRLLGNGFGAFDQDDLAQAGMEALWRKWPDVGGPPRVINNVYTVAYRQMIDELRDQLGDNRRLINRGPQPLSLDWTVDGMPMQIAAISTQGVANDDWLDLRAALAQLPPRDALCAVAASTKGYQERLAPLLGVSTSRVSQLHRRGLARLKVLVA